MEQQFKKRAKMIVQSVSTEVSKNRFEQTNTICDIVWYIIFSNTTPYKFYCLRL